MALLPNDDGYDEERALFRDDVLEWLADTQADELAKVVSAGSPSEAQQRSQVLDRLVKVLDAPLEAGGGMLNVLRKGFQHISARFALAQLSRSRRSTRSPSSTTARCGGG